MLQRGHSFAPGYRLQEFLGRGQFGEVWRASAPGGTVTAVKFIDLSGGSGQKEFAAIKRIKKIQQANLMPITAIWLLDEEGKVIEDQPDLNEETVDIRKLSHSESLSEMADRDPALLVVAMLLGGQCLLSRMKHCQKVDGTGIPVKELLSYMEDSAKGLDYLNEPRHDLGQGLVAIQHCDVKPANIVILGNSAVICDFGLARLLSRNQITATSAAGTPAYMAPEAIEGRPSQNSDQYSLAITYYHLRTATLPVADGTLFEVLDAHRRGALRFDKVPPAERDVLRRATALHWQDRFDSNGDFIEALRDSIRGGSLAAIPTDAVTDPNTVTLSGSSEGIRQTVVGNLEATTQDGDLGNKAAGASPAAVSNVETTGWSSNLSRYPTSSSTAQQTIEVSSSRNIAPLAKRKWKWLAAAAVGLPIAVWGIASSVDSVPIPSPDPMIDVPTRTLDPQMAAAELLERARQNLLHNPDQAAANYRDAFLQNPGISESKPLLLSGHSDAVEGVWKSAPGSALISIGYDTSPKRWVATDANLPPSNYRSIKLTPFEQPIFYSAAIDSEGPLLVAGGGNGVRLWRFADVQRGGHPTEQSINENQITPVLETEIDLGSEVVAVAIDKSGLRTPETLIAATADGMLTQLTVNSGTLQSLAAVPTGQTARSIVIDPTSRYLAATLTNTGVIVHSLQDFNDSSDVASGGNPIVVADSNAGVKFASFVKSKTNNEPPQLKSDEVILITASAGGTLTSWAIGDTAETTWRIQAHTSSIESLSVGNQFVVSGSDDGYLSISKRDSNPSQTMRDRIATAAVAAVDITRDDQWIAAGTYDGRLWLIRRDKWPETAAVMEIENAQVDCVCIDEENDRLIAGCSDKTIRIWPLDIAKLNSLITPPPAVDPPQPKQQQHKSSGSSPIRT